MFVIETSLYYDARSEKHQTSIYYSWFQTFAMFWMLYYFFCMIPRRLNLTCLCFGTICYILISGVSRKIN